MLSYWNSQERAIPRSPAIHAGPRGTYGGVAGRIAELDAERAGLVRAFEAQALSAFKRTHAVQRIASAARGARTTGLMHAFYNGREK